METERIVTIRKLLEIITFAVIFTVMINSFSGTNFIRKIKNNHRELKVYYLMDFRLFDGRYLNKDYVITQISTDCKSQMTTDDFICDHPLSNL